MTKVEAIGEHGEPVLILSLTREDLEVLIGGRVFSQAMRSKSGIDATFMLSCCEDGKLLQKLVEEGCAHRVIYTGPLMEAGEVVGG
jgi:hypothetical protein